MSAVPVVASIIPLAGSMAGSASAIFHVALLILRNIDIIVPFVLDKIDGSAAGVILLAVFPPIFLMARRNTQVHGFLDDPSPWRRNDDGFGMDNLRLGIVADVDVAVEPGLTDRDGYADVCGLHRDCRKNDCEDN